MGPMDGYRQEAEALHSPEELEMELEPAVGWTEALQAQFGSAPWWVISSVVHVVMLLLLSLLMVSQPRPVVRAFVQDIDWVKPTRPEPPLTPPPVVNRQFVMHDKVPTADFTLILHEEPEDDSEIETDNNDVADSARGQEEALSDVPLFNVGVIASLGVGLSTPAGAHGFGDRGGRRRRGRSRWGDPSWSTEKAHKCVNRALEWLARHQEAEGHWEGEKYEGKNTDAGITGLAALAFLGAGFSERHKSKFQINVRRAVAWLIRNQQADGSIGRGYEGGLGYHHSIAGLALAEAYGMGRYKRTGIAAQKAVDYSIATHQNKYSGWRYKAGQAPDMSVTGWFVMQLKSAVVANLRVDGSGFQGAVTFLDQCTKRDGDYPGRVSYQPSRSATPTMTSVGAVSRLFMGWKKNDPLIIGAAHELASNLPRWDGNSGGVNFYYWYYGTLAMFQVGGDFWKSWNVSMRDMLVEHQRRGAPDVDGSWNPVGAWCGRGGRVFSTAMGALCLEVYYRYPVMLR